MKKRAEPKKQEKTAEARPEPKHEAKHAEPTPAPGSRRRANVAAALDAFEAANGRPARTEADEGGTDVVFCPGEGCNFHLDLRGEPRFHGVPPGYRFDADGTLTKEGSDGS